MAATVSELPSGVDMRPRFTVDLDIVAENFRSIARHVGAAEVAPVVKADGYGCGAHAVARRLWDAGARRFFVATIDEGAALRPLLPAATIYLLNGFAPGAAGRVAQSNLTPVLNSRPEIDEWLDAHADRPAAIHIDTGMSRNGLSAQEFAALTARPQLLKKLKLELAISHLACADEADSPMNGEQRKRFKAALAKLPPMRASLAASGGISLSPDYHFDLVRPGIALYGVDPLARGEIGLRTAVRLTARVTQVREIGAGDTVGYGATFQAHSPTRIATVAIGYADGILRSLVNKGAALIGGVNVSFAGRVSMDLITLDVTTVPTDRVQRGSEVELIGPTLSIESMALRAGTAPYEILTRLGGRVMREHHWGSVQP